MPMNPLPQDHPLRRLFSGTVQQVLYADIGMCDPQIADYLTDLLSSFIHIDDLYPLRDASGRRLEDVAEMVTEARLDERAAPAARQRMLHKHIGDFALFWTGLFPEGLRRMRRFGAADRLTVYLQQGKRSYSIASELTHDDDQPPAGVLRRLSDRFEYCVYGLHLCRREWDALGEGFLPPQ
jgi:hypothetical protein